jgi:putative membrane protein
MIIIGPIFTLLVLIAIAAIFVWIADWVSGGSDIGRRSALETLDRRFANGEIDRAEYEAKYKLIAGTMRDQ